MTDFMQPTGIDMMGQYGLVRYGEDNQKTVIFYIRSVENPAISREKGARYFENKVFIKIHEPGESLNIVDRPVNDHDKDRWPIQWGRFIQNKAQIPDGTLVDLLFPNNPAVADNLKSRGIYTIQQLAKLSANAMDTIGMGATEWVNMANAYLKNASDGTAFLQLQEKIKSFEQELRIKNDQIAKLIKQVDTMVASYRNPDFNRMQPPFIPNYDVQSERIDNLHVTKDIATRSRPSKKKQSFAEQVEQEEILNQVIREPNAKD